MSIIYKKNYGVDLSDVDFKKELKLSALFNYFQDIANQAAETLGLGFTTIYEQYGVLWALIRMRVDIKRLPILGEKIRIETWPLEPKTLEFERDFLVFDENSNIIIRGVSTWVILDKNSRRIKRTSIINPNYKEIVSQRAIDCQLGKFSVEAPCSEVYKKVVGYSDIDLNGHLNNSKYIDFIMDCFTLEEHQKYSVQSIEVSFVNETLIGETLTLCQDLSRLDENVVYIEGVNEEKDRISFKAQLTII